MNLLGTLAFLVTLLFLAISLGIVCAGLLRRRARTAAKAAAFILVWLAIYASILLAVSLTSRESLLEQGQEHCFDEMCFSLQRVTETRTLGNSQAAGIFYIVTVRLRNAARRTAQKPSNPRLSILDAAGREYEQMLDAEGDDIGRGVSAAELWNRQLNPGEIVEQRVAFDLPPGVPSPKLVITEGSGFPTDVIIGDENSLLHAKTAFRLK